MRLDVYDARGHGLSPPAGYSLIAQRMNSDALVYSHKGFTGHLDSTLLFGASDNCLVTDTNPLLELCGQHECSWEQVATQTFLPEPDLKPAARRMIISNDGNLIAIYFSNYLTSHFIRVYAQDGDGSLSHYGNEIETKSDRLDRNFAFAKDGEILLFAEDIYEFHHANQT